MLRCDRSGHARLLIENDSAITSTAIPRLLAPRHFRSRLATIQEPSCQSRVCEDLCCPGIELFPQRERLFGPHELTLRESNRYGFLPAMTGRFPMENNIEYPVAAPRLRAPRISSVSAVKAVKANPVEKA